MEKIYSRLGHQVLKDGNKYLVRVSIGTIATYVAQFEITKKEMEILNTLDSYNEVIHFFESTCRDRYLGFPNPAPDDGYTDPILL